MSAPDEVSGAVRGGQTLGRVAVLVDGRRAAVSPLVAAHAVGAATTLDKVLSTAQNPIVLFGLAAVVILVVLLLTMRGRGSRKVGNPVPQARQERQRSPRQRTPEERRRMHEERMRRRRQRMEREGGTG